MLAALALGAGPPAGSMAFDPGSGTGIAPSPTPLQVTPPPTSAERSRLLSPAIESGREILGSLTEWAQARASSPALKSGVLPWTAAGIALLSLALWLLLRIRHQRRQASGMVASAPTPTLKSLDGRLYLQLDSLEDGMVIGRGQDGVDLPIDETIPDANTVSNRHARVYFDKTCGYVVIEDLGSTNGVFINGRRAPRKNLLKDGWVVGLGNVILKYYDGESDTGPLD